jgi:hypothetical protein
VYSDKGFVDSLFGDFPVGYRLIYGGEAFTDIVRIGADRKHIFSGEDG